MDPEKVVLAISIGAFKEVSSGPAIVDKEEKEALEKAKARRPRIKLEAIGIKPGDILHFSRDESVTATVVESGNVIFENESMSPSAAAIRALNRMGYKIRNASGSQYWKFEGELVDERRRRIEAEQFEEVDPET